MSFFERLDANQGIKNITNDIVENHLNNSAITSRFNHMKMTPDELKSATAMFFIAKTKARMIIKAKVC